MAQVKLGHNLPPTGETDPLMEQTVMLIQNSGMTLTAISNKSGVARQTMVMWRLRKTKRPYASSMHMVLRVLGYRLTITRD